MHDRTLGRMPEERPAALDSVFQALSDPTRRTILRSLAAGKHNISEVAALHVLYRRIKTREGVGEGSARSSSC
jgi:DNA-binding transcriptional ArsR family regulator